MLHMNTGLHNYSCYITHPVSQKHDRHATGFSLPAATNIIKGVAVDVQRRLTV